MEEVKRHVLRVLGEAASEEISPEDLVSSPVSDFGSPVAFKLAKRLKRNPADIASEIVAKIKPDRFIRGATSEGGYVNFELDYRGVTEVLLSGGEAFKRKGKVVLEHTSVNPTGPVHVGRIRNSLIGDCLRRILGFWGYDVETHYYVNDIGKQVAIIAAGITGGVEQDSGLKANYGSYGRRGDYDIFFTYVAANRRFEGDVGFQERVQSMIKAAESGDMKSLEGITSVAKRCLQGQLETFNRLGIRFDVFDYESEFLNDGSVGRVLDDVRRDSRYLKSEVGEGLDLEEYGIDKRGGMSVLARADGTSVYLTRDVAYHLRKVKLGERVINVLGEDHKLEFQELKAILSGVFKIDTPIEAVHFSFVSFEGTKFSTRKGEIATVDELLDEAISKAKAEVDKRKIGDDRTAQAVGIGAVRFHITKTSPNKQITFRWEDALNFEGDSGPYVQYAHARSCRIIEKCGVDLEEIKDVDYDITDEEEKKLVLKLLEFSDVVEYAAKQLRPDLVASYLIELTGVYGGFYMNCPVLDSEGGVRNRRLLLVAKLRDTIKTGLGLLGIEAPDRM
ncbi:MAG: arginine--tRNA ligase [Candidatus Altiarchaeota archaeon]